MSNVIIGGTPYEGVNVVKIPLEGNTSEYAEFTNRENAILDGTFSGDFENNQVTKIRSRALEGMTGITAVKMANVTDVEYYAFSGCTSMKTLEMPKLKNIGNASFINCKALVEVFLPSAEAVNAIMAFQGCDALKKVDLAGPKSTGGWQINANAFEGCDVLDTFIIRSSLAVVSLNNANAFANTPIANGTGYVYVPKSILSQYTENTSWETYKNQLRAIEDYPDICG